ncbi:MAG: GNAT family N-acetyltransferase [Nitrososphaerota archaeon]|jgi:GNAT superfamily N-acetyltransferase|nr:GNAT family N-acetyltransferase [Nitrososphaerota archaeon]
MTVEEFDFAVELANSMHWNMNIEDFWFSLFLEPKGCFILFNNITPIGIATCTSFGKIGWFGNFVVKEEHQRRGGGSLLLKHAVNYLQARGVETIGLYAYPHLEEFYNSFGFKTDLGLTVMYNSCVQDSKRAVLKFESCVDFSLLTSFDRQFFGADRSHLLKEIIKEHGKFCHVFREKESVVGYILAKGGNKGIVEVGPLICCPNRSDVAFELLKAILNQLSGRQVLLYMPKNDKGKNDGVLEEFLLSAGFRRDFSLLKMFLGKSNIQSGVYLAESLERG